MLINMLVRDGELRPAASITPMPRSAGLWRFEAGDTVLTWPAKARGSIRMRFRLGSGRMEAGAGAGRCTGLGWNIGV